MYSTLNLEPASEQGRQAEEGTAVVFYEVEKKLDEIEAVTK